MADNEHPKRGRTKAPKPRDLIPASTVLKRGLSLTPAAEERGQRILDRLAREQLPDPRLMAARQDRELAEERAEFEETI